MQKKDKREYIEVKETETKYERKSKNVEER